MRIQRGGPSSPEVVKSCCDMCTNTVYPGEEASPQLARGMFSFGDYKFDMSPGARACAARDRSRAYCADACVHIRARIFQRREN
jgi:hypothetical protein